MPRFLTADELGNIKVLRYSPGPSTSEIKTLHRGEPSTGGIQALSITSGQGQSKEIATAHSSGSIDIFSLDDDDTLTKTCTWQEPPLKKDQHYIGLGIFESAVFSCTSNGALRMTKYQPDNVIIPFTRPLPMRLLAWRLSQDSKHFIHGGDEVDVSIWDTELAFSSTQLPTSTIDASKKRRRDPPLLLGEIWRAKNVPNDTLGLRQPIRVTSLTYVYPKHIHDIIAGTQLGDVRRYDTRAARRPISEWKEVSKLGGVKIVEKGHSENEMFVSDSGQNLVSLDLRNGRVLYAYKGLSGAITSIAPSPSIMVSTSLDRYARVHSTFPPPAVAGQQQERKGDILEKIFVKSTPTVVVWDQDQAQGGTADPPEADDDVWENMENVGEDSDGDSSRPRRRPRQE
ncbi:hypothetical protein BD779DRAFT_843249 [Infundibulicybe gibba]|nr:hypothetical protein BD779DRAFT_843249 [Infundibulicybe gibba]